MRNGGPLGEALFEDWAFGEKCQVFPIVVVAPHRRVLGVPEKIVTRSDDCFPTHRAVRQQQPPRAAQHLLGFAPLPEEGEDFPAIRG